MTSKERAALRAQANTLEPVFHIGKGGISETLIKETADVLRKRELIKIKILLDTAPGTPRELADTLAEATQSEVVQLVGGCIILYKENPELDKDGDKSSKKKKPAKKTQSKPLSRVKAKRAAEERRKRTEKAIVRNRKTYAKKSSSK